MISHALATIERGAVGNHALAITDALRESSVDVTVYAETIRQEFVSTTRTINELRENLRPSDLVFYQFANPSPMADLLLEKDCRLIVNYHNITPAHYFARWFPPTAAAISRARSQLARLAPVTAAAIAVSEYNASELIALGYKNVEIIPPVFSDRFYSPIPRDTREDSWLYVGRIAPHKNVHSLIHAFDVYREDHSQAHLTIVGTTDTPLYGKAIDELIVARGLTDSISIVSHASSDDLLQRYAQASVFVSLSEHEGFCVPLIEAMAMGVPVVALNSSAIPETCGSAAVLVDSVDPHEVAQAVHALVNEGEDVKVMTSRGKVRSEKFHPGQSVQRYVEYLSGWLS